MHSQGLKELQMGKKEKPLRSLYHQLEKIVGPENVWTSFPDKITYARDRWPLATLKYRFGALPGALPHCIVTPETVEEVSEVIKLSGNENIPIIPFGAGSGVLGGTIPLEASIILDTKRLNRILEIDGINGIATVQAGMNGELFEASLNRKGLTLGHFPQSLHCSTVGGWLATRSAGQASTKYGKIEDMVISLQVVLPNGDIIHTKTVPRSATGPNINHIFIGSEGTLGVITQASFRIWPYPERESIHVMEFPDVLSGLDALRRIMQSEIKPSIVRLYDELESAALLGKSSHHESNPCLLTLVFHGGKEAVELEESIALRLCQETGAKEGTAEPAYRWMEERFHSRTPKQVAKGNLLDTIEVAAPWSKLSALYEGMQNAILKAKPSARVSAHWSHIYPDGACMYMTFIFNAPEESQSQNDYYAVWDGAMEACLTAGGTISHHHGIGLMRGKWIEKEHGPAFQVLRALKKSLDPKDIMNPGKLGL